MHPLALLSKKYINMYLKLLEPILYSKIYSNEQTVIHNSIRLNVQLELYIYKCRKSHSVRFIARRGFDRGPTGADRKYPGVVLDRAAPCFVEELQNRKHRLSHPGRSIS